MGERSEMRRIKRLLNAGVTVRELAPEEQVIAHAVLDKQHEEAPEPTREAAQSYRVAVTTHKTVFDCVECETTNENWDRRKRFVRCSKCYLEQEVI